MIYYIQFGPLDGVDRTYDIIPAMNLLGDMYPTDRPCYLMYIKGLRKPDGTPARGGYGVLKGETDSRGIIYLTDGMDWGEAVSILIHEYAHHLSQQDHGFVMYELWREWLREEFVRRYEDVKRETDQRYDRSRIVEVGEVGCNGECEHVSPDSSGC